MSATISLKTAQARQLWIEAQKLHQTEPFGKGAPATRKAIEHLGYVQIDTINVIERCHHHILFNRIPNYQRQDLHRAQTLDKSIFEYWTHALSFVPTRDYRFFMNDMTTMKATPGNWFKSVKKADLDKVLNRIKKEGPISIRDIKDDVLVEKDHDWAGRKPSKRAMQLMFYTGQLVVSERLGMLKKYNLSSRHFDWEKKPKAATEKEILNYLLDRALRSQSVVSLNSICHLDAPRKKPIRALIEARVKNRQLIPVQIQGAEKIDHWINPLELERKKTGSEEDLTHILSPFDPLIIQRARLHALFDYEHRFEAYVPAEKRILGYFALPVLMDGEIVAALDLKTDRESKRLLIQKWTWMDRFRSPSRLKRIEEALHTFESFQLAR